MKARIEAQAKLSAKISRFHDNLKKIGQANITQGTIEARLEDLNEKWRTFKDEHDQIEEDATAEDLKTNYFINDFFSATEEIFFTQKGKLLDAFRSIGGASYAAPRVDAAPVIRQSLPRINLPKFSGNYSDWLNFRDIFKSMVIDASLSQIERMHYLKTSLTKETSSLIASIATTADNFDVAWEALTTRYENIRLLANAQIAALFSLSAMTSESAAELKTLYNGTANALGALKALERPIETCDDFTVDMTVQKLDKQSRREWETSIGATKEPPTFKTLQTFLENRICSIEALEGAAKPRETSTAPKNASSSSSRHSKKLPSISAQTGTQSPVASSAPTAQKCALCQQPHFILFCENFREKSADDRKAFVLSNKLCLNCLGHHYARDCRSPKTCQTCKAKHHTMLHETYATPTQTNSNDAKPPSDKPSTSTTAQTTTLTATKTYTRVLLATALLHVSSRYEDKVLVRALIDQGSEATFVSESLAQRLNLPRSSASVFATGIRASAATTSRGAVALHILSRVKSNFTCQVNALVIPKLIAYQLPSVTITSRWNHLEGLSLADPDFLSSRPIELLLGADIYPQLILDGVRKGSANSPLAQNTQLGWIISGRIAPLVASCSALASMQVSLDTSLSFSLQRFCLPSTLLPEESDREQHFLKTHSRNQDGRYIVRLPFKKPLDSLGDSLTTPRICSKGWNAGSHATLNSTMHTPNS